jgi:pyruvate,water dikinase
VIWLDEIGDADRLRVGGKAFVLARLRRAGLPVPDGFVVTADEAIDGGGSAGLRAAAARLGGTAAVRSSATLEDTAEASFAGQYRTLLDVNASARAPAVEEVRRSAGEAEGYARALGVGGARIHSARATIPVLVQRFVEPRAAGVLFTRHPTDPGAMLVETHAGRGEAVVSGAVRPDRYVLDRETGAVRVVLGDAEHPPAQGASAGLIPARAKDAPGGSLAESELGEVFTFARRVEGLLGGPQDIEWALGAQGFVLLQARPITVGGGPARDPRLRRLTRANVGEVLPDPVTPLTATTVLAFLEQAFRNVTDRAGLLPPDAPPFLVLHRERLYLNLSLCLDVGRQLPGLDSAEVERLILGTGARGAARRVASLLAWARLARVVARVRRMARDLPAEIESAQEALRRLPPRLAVERANPEELLAMLGGLERAGSAVATVHVATSGACGVRLALLTRLLDLLVPGAAEPRVNRLVTGLPGLESAAPAEALEALAGQVQGQPEWIGWLARQVQRSKGGSGGTGESPQFKERAKIHSERANDEAPAELGVRLKELLRRWGHRGVSEAELRAASWEDDPAPLLVALHARALSPRTPGFRARAAEQLGRADAQALDARLGPLRSSLVRWGISRAREWVARREATKSLAVSLVDHGRDIVRSAARRLVTAGALADVDDVFFLTAQELRAALRGTAPSRAALARRRRRWEREAALPAPREVDFGAVQAPPAAEGSGGTGESPRLEERAQIDSARADDELLGIGVSAGVGAGPARVVRPGEAMRLEPGEVLVAPVLDAGLGPLLASAAGAVAEIGGLLSHGAVVARELGVPCVVDVKDATRRIEPGERILVDGGSGRVRRMPAGTSDGGGKLFSPIRSVDPADEDFPPLENHPQARESVYFNLLDPDTGLGIVCSLGRKRGGRGEAILGLRLPDGKLLFGLELDTGRREDGALAVGGLAAGWRPSRLRAETRLAEHDAESFPPGPIKVLLAPRTVEIRIDLSFHPTTPAVDLCAIVDEETRRQLEPLGAHHVEQSGRAAGEVVVDGRRYRFAGTGSRDHSFGRRDWDAADHWGLFTLRLGEDIALHALAVCVRGRMIEGGFLWREGRLERVTRLEHVWEEGGGKPRAVGLEVSTDTGAPLHVRGTVLSTLSVPVQPERRLLRHLAGRPWRLVLDESFTRYEGAGRTGFGIAERARR